MTSSTVIGCSTKHAEEFMHCSSHAVTEENVDAIFATAVTKQLFTAFAVILHMESDEQGHERSV